MGDHAVLVPVMAADAGADPVTDPGQGRTDVAARDLHRLARGSSLNLAGSLVAAALNLALPVLITRGLAQADAGVFFQVTALFTILVTVGTVGADTGVLRALPRAIALERPADVRPVLRTAVVVPVGIALVLAVALALLADPVADLAVGGQGAAGTGFSGSVLVLACFLPVAVGYAVGLAASRGLGSVLPLVVVEKLGRTTAQVAAVWVAVAVGTSTVVLVLAWALPYVAALLVVGWWVGRRVRAAEQRAGARRGPDAAAPTAGVIREFWGFAAPRAVSRVFSVALQRFDILVVGALRGPEDAALYAAATRFPILGLMFVQAIQQVMAPRISEFLARDDPGRAQAIYRTTVVWLTLVSWPIYGLSVCYAGVLLDVFGSDYDEATSAVVVLCLAMLVATACGPVDSVLLMGGRSVLSLVNTGLALAVTVTLDLLLIPGLGVLGAAIGWAVGILVNNLLPLWQVHRTLGMHPFGRGAAIAAALCIGCYGLVAVAVRLLLGEGVWSLLVAGALGTALFGAGLVRWRQPLELDALRAVVRRRRPARPEGAG